MNCPFCRADSRVVDSRSTEDGTAIRRRRVCPRCGRRFSTIETASLTVVKRSGVSEPFSRANRYCLAEPCHRHIYCRIHNRQ